MKKWLGVSVFVLVGVVVGFAGAYALGSLEAISGSPLTAVDSAKSDGFNQVFTNVAHLGATEQAAANCSGKNDLQPVLTNEAKVIAVLVEKSKNLSRITPPMDAAEARLAIRALIEAERHSGSNASPDLLERATRLASSAGWKNSSEAHLREIIVALNKDHCEQLSIPGAAR